MSEGCRADRRASHGYARCPERGLWGLLADGWEIASEEQADQLLSGTVGDVIVVNPPVGTMQIGQADIPNWIDSVDGPGSAPSPAKPQEPSRKIGEILGLDNEFRQGTEND